MNLKTVLVAVVAIAATSLGWYFGQSQRIDGVNGNGSLPGLEIKAGTAFETPREVADFKLQDQDGEPVNLDRLRNRWTFVYLGYTYCPDVCPTTMAELGRVSQQLASVADVGDVQYLFVSVDPRRDTHARLKEYVAYFGEDFVGATGIDEDLKSFATNIGQVYVVPADPVDENYLVDHSSVLALFDPAAKLHAVFTSPHQASDIEASFRAILARYLLATG